MTVSMTALTLRQPWASLISSGGKLFESRTWAPPVPLIGQRIAIHAGKSKISNGLSDEELAAIRSGLDADDLAALPRGMIVCTARIAGAYRVGAFCGTSNRITFDDRVAGSPTVDNIVVPASERFLSDVLPGYWLWQLVEAGRFTPPVPATGRLGLWRWTSDPSHRPPT